MNKNKLIRKRRIFFLRRMVFVFLIFVIFVLVLINSPIFTIKNLNINGNKILSTDYVTQNLNKLFHKNIFFYPIDSEFKTLKENKYIKNISFKREFPHTLNIDIKEVNVDYYIYKNNQYYIFDRDSTLIDILEYKDEFEVMEIEGVDFNDLKIGNKLFKEGSRELLWLKNLSELFDLNKSDIKFDSVNIKDVFNVFLVYSNIKIKIGNNSDLRQKINTAINIINSNPKFKSMKGYIDVRSKNYPVILLE